MKFRKLTIASSVCLALTGVSGLANAAIPGVPGEALLVPGVMTGGPTNQVPAGAIETYIALRVPVTIGQDTVINTYTAPHTTVAQTVVTQVLDDPRIYWSLFNENSQKVEDGYCNVSPGDAVLWTTDPYVQDLQRLQQAALNAAGVDRPLAFCGPSLRTRFGYVIFQTISGADGQDADFAFGGEASTVLVPMGAAFGLPVMPMADGADPLPAGSGFPEFTNEIITGTGSYGDGFATAPVRYSPITAGIRLSDADGITTENVITQMGLTGPAANNGMTLHVLWYPNNDPTRASYGDIFDDNEEHCSMVTPLPRQLNAYLYNSKLVVPEGSPTPAPNWGNAEYLWWNEGGYVTDLIGVVMATGGSTPYCSPPYWQDGLYGLYPGAIIGYHQYSVPEFNFGQSDGVVHAAGVQFSAIQHSGSVSQADPSIATPENGYFSAWTTHNALDLGKQ